MSQNNQFQSTTQKYLDIYDVTNNLVILKDGTVSFVLTVSAMNFGLLAEAEQDAVIYTYAALLNSLNYPIQIIIQSQTKDATTYLNLLKTQEQKASSERKQERISRYRHFVSNLIRERNVLDKKFYVVVPASPIELGLLTADSVIPGRTEFDVSKYEKSVILEKAELALEPKRDHLISQFARIGLYARQLSTQEIIRIFYTSYNPEASEGQEIADSTQYTTPLVRANLVQQTQQLLKQNSTAESRGAFSPPSNQVQINDQSKQSEQQVASPSSHAQPMANMPGAKRPQTKAGGTSTPLTQPEENKQANSAAQDGVPGDQTSAATQESAEQQTQNNNSAQQGPQQRQQQQPQPTAPRSASPPPLNQAPATEQTTGASVPEPSPKPRATSGPTPNQTPQSQAAQAAKANSGSTNSWTENIDDFSVDLSGTPKTTNSSKTPAGEAQSIQTQNTEPKENSSERAQQESQEKQLEPDSDQARSNPVLANGGGGENPQSIIDQTLKEVKVYDQGSSAQPRKSTPQPTTKSNESKNNSQAKKDGEPQSARRQGGKSESNESTSSQVNNSQPSNNLPPIAEIK